MRVEEISRILEDGSVFVDVGPMRMRIHVWKGNHADSDLALDGAEKAYSLLQELGAHKETVTRNIPEVRTYPAHPGVVSRMIESVRSMDDPTMTPLAAVAGTVADEVADYIRGLASVSKVMVNNGGDIAVRLREGAEARIGVQENLSRSEFTHLLTLHGSHHVGGIATSGMGGRSFTRGIASAVTVAASNASTADAAATLVANAVDVSSPNIKRVRAEEIYPDTDIPGRLVTVSVGPLSGEAVEKALTAGMESAERLRTRGLIKGALLALKGVVKVSEELRPLLRPRNCNSQIGNGKQT